MLRVGTQPPDAPRPVGENAYSTRCYGDTATRSAQGVRDDAKHRHEVADGFDECPLDRYRKPLQSLNFEHFFETGNATRAFLPLMPKI